MRFFLSFIFRVWAWSAAAIYKGEGLNLPLRVMPTQFIAPLLRRYGADIGNDVRFCAPLTIHNSEIASRHYYHNLSVGDHCYFGRELFLDLQDRIIVENGVTISHRVMILTHTDAGTSPLKDTAVATSQAPVRICTGAYIGAQATILEGTEIGRESVVGAGALVTHSIPAGMVVTGVPARILRPVQDTD